MWVKLEIKIATIAVVLIITSALAGCKKEGCTNALAENYVSGATEDDGSCVYPRDKFIGVFSVTESCNSGNQTYDISVSTSSVGVNYIDINNLGDFGLNSTAEVSGDNISFDHTSVGVNFSGTGSINGNQLTIDYIASAGGVSDTCTMNCTKQ